MRVLCFLGSILSGINIIYSQTVILGEEKDTLSVDTPNSYKISYMMVPALAKYETRYHILSNVDKNETIVGLNYYLQDILSLSGINSSEILNGFNFLKNTLTEEFYSWWDMTINERDIFYGSWRNNLIRAKNEEEIKQSLINGTWDLIGLGYRDLGKDFLTFIASLMEESHLINYNHTRLYPGKASRGIVPSVRMLNAMIAQNTTFKAGVCRDIHETGRELLKSVAETWYGHFYPDMKIAFDDYIFLQSWTTNTSHHITISLIDPVNPPDIYELDWGRVIKRVNMNGFNNGRLYGNNYRIWQYDSDKKRTSPVDYKRTQFGKILDENILTPDEYRKFNGIFDKEFYSDTRYNVNLKKSGHMNFSLGTYHPHQKYLLSGWFLNTNNKRITGFLNHSNKYAIQAAVHEDTRKKTFLYPHVDWKAAVSLMTVGRYISRFETPEYKIGKITIEGYMFQQIDAFLTTGMYLSGDSIDLSARDVFTFSGDGNISFSNGLNIKHASRSGTFYSSAGIQARSCMLVNDIRLFSPDPIVLFSNLKIITPAIDVFGKIELKLKETTKFSVDALVEFTNLKSILYSGCVSVSTRLSGNTDIGLSFGTIDQLKGMHYFWYPTHKKWIDMSIRYSVNRLSAGLLRMPVSGTTFNLSYIRELRRDF